MQKTIERATSPILTSFGYPLVYMSAVMLQAFTAYTAYNLVNPGQWRYAAAMAAFALPPISDLVVAYFAWRRSGSMINGYSVWVLIWMLVLLLVVGLGVLRERRRH